MKRSVVAATLVLMGMATHVAAGDKVPDSAAVYGQYTSIMGLAVYPYGAVKVAAIWSKPGLKKGTIIPLSVCWEKLSDSSPEQRSTVRNAIAATWEKYGSLSFTGWGKCAGTPSDMRIAVTRFESGTLGLGQEIKHIPGGISIQLDYSSAEQCKDDPDFCLRATAVHEFGHALGFAHEQNREDAPDWCKKKHQGDYPDKNITEYDEQSIMNYCNKNWHNNGLLSAKDIQTVTTVYGGKM